MIRDITAKRSCVIAMAVGALLATAAANAAIVPVANGGALILSETTTGGGSTPFGDISSPASPGNFTYSNSWISGPQTTFVGSTGSGFYDDFVFTIGPGQVDSITSSITLGDMLGISGLQVRLYDYNANLQAAPLLTDPIPGSAFDAWSSTVTFPGGTTTVNVLPPTTLTAGTYVIEVRGTVSGVNGGNYTGSLNLTPVPLPAGLPSLLGGLALLACYAWRRPTSQAPLAAI